MSIARIAGSGSSTCIAEHLVQPAGQRQVVSMRASIRFVPVAPLSQATVSGAIPARDLAARRCSARSRDARTRLPSNHHPHISMLVLGPSKLLGLG
jgi:hypothetical protein